MGPAMKQVLLTLRTASKVHRHAKLNLNLNLVQILVWLSNLGV
jgi:hypothetical protein